MILDTAKLRSSTQRDKGQFEAFRRHFQVCTNSTLRSCCFQSVPIPSAPRVILVTLTARPGTAGSSILNCWSSQILLPSSLQMCRHTHTHTSSPQLTLPQLTLLLLPPPPDLFLPQLLPRGFAQSLQEASQLPRLSPAAKKEKQAKEENKTSGTPRKAIWVILFERLEVIAAIYTGKKRREKKKNRPHFHTYQPQGDEIE